MNINEIKGAIFDLDGTLLNSMPLWKHFGEKYLIDRGIMPKPGLNDLVKTLTLRESAAFFRSQYGIRESEDVIMKQINDMIYNQYRNEIQFKPHAREFVQRLYRQGTPCCICTVTSQYMVEAALARLDSLQYFRFILSSDEGGSKSDPAIFETALKRLGTKRNETVVFEDSLYAITTAKSVGFRVAALHDEAAEHDLPLIRNMADEYLDSFAEIVTD